MHNINDKQKIMLRLLDNQIQKCTECELHTNGRAKPYWTENSKWMMLFEAPGKEEVEANEVICGKTGRMFWELLEEYQLTKDQFLIMNSVNCRVMDGRKNGKPSEYHRNMCRPWIRKYMKVFQPNIVLLFGNYSIHTILKEWGITKYNGLLTEENLFDSINTKVIRCFHPSAMIYDKSKKDKILKTIKLFKSEALGNAGKN